MPSQTQPDRSSFNGFFLCVTFSLCRHSCLSHWPIGDWIEYLTSLSWIPNFSLAGVRDSSAISKCLRTVRFPWYHFPILKLVGLLGTIISLTYKAPLSLWRFQVLQKLHLTNQEKSPMYVSHYVAITLASMQDISTVIHTYVHWYFNAHLLLKNS